MNVEELEMSAKTDPFLEMLERAEVTSDPPSEAELVAMREGEASMAQHAGIPHEQIVAQLDKLKPR